MKKLLVSLSLVSSLAAIALPTYEPFTEYSSLVTANPTNSIDLATGGYTVTTGSTTEHWGGLLYSALPTNNVTGVAGLDIQVTNNTATVFTQSALSPLFPAGFPGVANTIQVCALIPTNAANSSTVGNSAVLKFAQDFTRPTSGVKTIYVSYLFDVTQKGSSGGGNNGRYADFIASTNLVEPTSIYPSWYSFFNTFAVYPLVGPTYLSYGLKQNGTAGDFIGPSDSSGGNNGSVSTLAITYNVPIFVVSEVILTANPAANKDTNVMWINPGVGSFGGAKGPTTNTASYTAQVIMGDIGAFCLEDRLGTGTAGGIANSYMANLIIGTTWSYVTGGPEFTTQPSAASTNMGATVNLTGAAEAAGNQTISYQWQKVTGSATNNVTDGAGGAGGGATVSGSTTGSLTLTGTSGGDAGTYRLLATASGTGFTLPSTSVAVTVDPAITLEPQNAPTPPGGTAVFSISATTANPPLTYGWTLNGSPLTDGTRPDGSVFTGSTTNLLTVANYQPSDENGAIFQAFVTNALGASSASTAVTLSTADPAVTAQPASVTVNYGGSASLTASAQTATAGFTYSWYKGSTSLANGVQPDGSTATGAQGTSSGGTLTSTLTLANVSYLDDGSYALIATNAQGNTVTSAVATITVNDPYIVTQPAHAATAVGNSASFSVSASGAPTLSYQWYEGATALTDGPTGTGSTISGSTSPTLTISGASDSDDGSYHVVITSGSGASVTSASATLLVEDALSITYPPVSRTIGSGSHIAFVIGVSGTVPSYQWSFNNSPISGATNSSLILTNLTPSSNGTYEVTVTNLDNSVSASATLLVSNGLTHLAQGNLIVSRVGDGAEALNNSKGDTLYFDEVQPGGGYVCSVMVPDAVPAGVPWPGPALLALGTGDAVYEAMLTESANQYYLNFGGYNLAYPNTNGSINTGGAYWVRGIGALNALGYPQLVYTNFGLYSGGAAFRSVTSTDGLTNFWTTGNASTDGIKYVQAGPGGAGYAAGNGVPALYSSGPGTRVVQVVNGTIVYSDADATNVNAAGQGLCAYSGEPEPTTGISGTNVEFAEILDATASDAFASPVDFAFSPDLQTVYIADDNTIANGGGIQRWDTNAAAGAPYSWTYAYTIPPTASGTNGARGLVVDFSAQSTWGSGVTGAIIYATTAAATTNSLIEVADNGNPASVTPAWNILETASTNQLLTGVRFTPQPEDVSIVTQPQAVSTYVGQTATLSVGVIGDGPYTYQWEFNGNAIAGATNSTLVLSDAQATNGGQYTVLVSDDISSQLSSPALVTISSGPPSVTAAPQSRVETAGDHLTFAVAVNGTLPLTYQWAFNGANIVGATNSILPMTNITTGQSGTYSVGATNQFGGIRAQATLQVTTGLQPLAANNYVVSRVGDGLEPLSAFTGNTIYLDQFQSNGTYVNTIMVPDTTPAGVGYPGPSVLALGAGDGVYESFLTLSQNGSYINFAGYNVDYPSTNSVNTGALPGGNIRAILSLDSFGYCVVTYTNVGAYSGGGAANTGVFIRSAASSDGLSEFWTTGVATSAGLKFEQYGSSTQDGSGIPALCGSDSGTRVAEVRPDGTVLYTDEASTPPGLWGAANLPTASTTPTDDIADSTGASPNDFAVSSDGQTIYIADDNPSTGGIQRWDSTGSSTAPFFALSYTLSTGDTTVVGARGISAVFQSGNGSGTTGQVIYATTAETNGNHLVMITDNGSPGSSTATTLVTAGPNQILIGIRPTPANAPTVQVIGQPVATSAPLGSNATFSVFAGGGPFTYQWQLSGAPLQNGASASGSGAVISGANSASLTISDVGLADQGGVYSVVVNNATPTSATSGNATLTVPFGSLSQVAVPLGGTAKIALSPAQSGSITYQWALNGTNLTDGPSISGSGATVSGSQTQTLTISDVGIADEGNYVLTINNVNNIAESSPATELVIVSTPQFNTNGVATVLPDHGGVQLNFSGTEGQPYRIWSSTNLDLRPITSTWTLVSQGTFSGGDDTFTDPSAAANKATFYVLTSP